MSLFLTLFIVTVVSTRVIPVIQNGSMNSVAEYLLAEEILIASIISAHCFVMNIVSIDLNFSYI